MCNPYYAFPPSPVLICVLAVCLYQQVLYSWFCLRAQRLILTAFRIMSVNAKLMCKHYRLTAFKNVTHTFHILTVSVSVSLSFTFFFNPLYPLPSPFSHSGSCVPRCLTLSWRALVSSILLESCLGRSRG